MVPLVAAISRGSRLDKTELRNLLQYLIVDDVEVMEFHHILADVEPEILVESGAQGLQQTIPSCLVTLRALIYLDFVRQHDGPLHHLKGRGFQRRLRLTTKPQTESLNFVHVILDLICSMSTSGSGEKSR